MSGPFWVQHPQGLRQKFGERVLTPFRSSSLVPQEAVMPARATSSLASAVLSGATTSGALTGILRFDLPPQRFVRYALSLSKSLPRCFQNGLRLGRVPHQQPLQVVLTPGTEQDRDRFALAGHHNRTLLGGLHVLRESGGDFVLGCNFHNSTSSP